MMRIRGLMSFAMIIACGSSPTDGPPNEPPADGGDGGATTNDASQPTDAAPSDASVITFDGAALPDGGSVLAQAAAALAPGEWAKFTTSFDNASSLADLIDSGNGKRITEYSDKMVWLPSPRQIRFTGQGHLQNAKTIVYTEVDNTWHDVGTPPWLHLGSFFHGYQHNTGQGSTHYVLQFGTTNVHAENTTNNDWTMVDTTGVQLGSDGAIGALEWFPTYGANGSLVLVDGNGDGVYRWDTTSWSVIGAPAMGGYQNAAVYSPIKDLMYFGGGGGSKALYTLSPSGTITPRTDAPVEYGIIQSITTVDPVNGKLVLYCIDRVVRIYDPSTDTWSTGSAPPSDFRSGNIYNEGDVMGIIAAPIYTYGVTMFIAINGPQVWLRKGGL